MTATTIIGAVLGTILISGGPAVAATARADDGLKSGDTAFVDVAAATLWVEPDTARELDAPSLTNPVDLDEWNLRMENTETRRWLTGRLETQAVLGSAVTVTDVSGDWAHVVVHDQATPRDSRGYPGWVPVDQLVEDDRFGVQQETKGTAIVTSTRTTLNGTPTGRHPKLEVSFNTELPVLTQNHHGAKVALPGGSSAWLADEDIDVYGPGGGPTSEDGADLVETARQFLGLRYLWAGVSAWGFDCSGFTYSVHRAHGIDIPRDASAQAAVGQDVAVEDLQAGDLLFFAQPGGVGHVHHVGMYIGDGKMIHAPNAAESVSIVEWQEWDDSGEFSGAKRMW